MHGAAGVIFDSINRMKSNRSLLNRERGAFNIQENIQQYSITNRPIQFKQADPEYLVELRRKMQEEKAKNVRLMGIRLTILAVLIMGLFYLAFGLTF